MGNALTAPGGTGRDRTRAATRPHGGRIVVAGLFLAVACGLRAADAGADLRWHDSMDAALTTAVAEYRPLLAVFTGPGCGWCRRLKQETLVAPEVVTLLRQYALVEIDVTRDSVTARQFRVNGVPTVLVLRADGEVVQGLTGFVTAEELVRALAQDLNPAAVRAQDPGTTRRLSRLQAGSSEEGDWPALMRSLSRREWHDEVVRVVESLKPFPRQALVGLLEHPLLAVRLGALELLETVRDGDAGFDPWRPQADEGLAGLARWHEWAAQAEATQEAPPQHYAALTAADLERCLEDLVSPDRERGVRALRRLARAGPEAGPVLTQYLESHPDLPTGARQRVREARYLAFLPPLPAADPADIAHRLVFGTPDVRLAPRGQGGDGPAVGVPEGARGGGAGGGRGRIGRDRPA